MMGTNRYLSLDVVFWEDMDIIWMDVYLIAS